ncbi:MAG: hypothetical protein WKF47_18620 [Geodermatophilaceae bacterium]
MTEPLPPGADSGARSLADILREAGIDSTGRGGRRRRPDAEPAPEPGPEREPEPGRDPEPEPGPEPGPEREPEPEPEPAPESAPEDRRGSVLGPLVGWLLFAVELVIAAVVGVLVWYSFRLLWELYPYAAALAAPVALTGLVAGGSCCAADGHPSRWASLRWPRWCWSGRCSWCCRPPRSWPGPDGDPARPCQGPGRQGGPVDDVDLPRVGGPGLRAGGDHGVRRHRGHGVDRRGQPGRRRPASAT